METKATVKGKNLIVEHQLTMKDIEMILKRHLNTAPRAKAKWGMFGAGITITDVQKEGALEPKTDVLIDNFKPDRYDIR